MDSMPVSARRYACMPIMPADPAYPLYNRVRAFIREQHLLPAGASVLAAVSGGPDSVALLDVLVALGYAVTVGHVNHHLRAEAGEDAAFVAALADRYHLPCLQREVDVPGRVAETGESVEEAARTLRYAALDEMMRETGTAYLATGHNADDQAETVLMRVLRGTGPTGLAGIPPHREAIVRPLLAVWRTEIEAYLAARELPYRIDLSNASTDFTRNRLRHELLPYLEAHYAPGLREQLYRLGEMARSDTTYLDGEAAACYQQLRKTADSGVMLPEDTMPPAILHRLWRLAIAEVRGDLIDIDYAHLQQIAHLPRHGEVHLPGVRVLHEAGRYVFLPLADGAEPITLSAQPLPVPGRLCLFAAGCCITSELIDGVPPMAGGDIALLDAEAVRGPLTLRGWQPGDRVRLLGAPGTRKVQDIFVDAGVPKRLRGRIPLLLDAEGIIWIAGFRPAERVKIEPATQRTLRVCIEWELNPWTLTPSNASSMS